MDLFGWFFVIAGLLSLAAAHFRWIEAAERNPMLRPLFAPYRLLNVRWIGGGLRRYLTTSGWFFLLLGVAVLLLDRFGRRG